MQYFINPLELGIEQKDVDALRPPGSGSIQQSQLIDLRSHLLRLSALLIDKQHLFDENFKKMTETEKFKRAYENTIRSQTQNTTSPKFSPDLIAPKPFLQQTMPNSPGMGPFTQEQKIQRSNSIGGNAVGFHMMDSLGGIGQGISQNIHGRERAMNPTIASNPALSSVMPPPNVMGIPLPVGSGKLKGNSKGTGNAKAKNPRPKVSETKEKAKTKKEKAEKQKDFKRIELSGDKAIWSNVDQFFGSLPSEEDIERLLTVPNYDLNPPVNPEHWSQRFIQIAQQPRESRKNTPLSLPPLPPPASSDVSDYWKDTTPTFQIEDTQMLNTSTIHRLLAALVVAEPMDETNHALHEEYLKTSPLPPKQTYNQYLSFSFDERLKWELESVGLSPDGLQKNMDDGPFDRELQDYQEKLKAIAPKLEKYKAKILAQLPRFKQNEQRRIKQNRTFLALVEEYNTGAFIEK